MFPRRILPILLLPLLAVAGSCATPGATTPYPAFVQTDALPDVFLATLPGARAKQFAGDPQTRRSSNRVLLPPDWTGTTGGAPDKSVEFYILRGKLEVGDLTLEPGGYAYFPPGFHGTNLQTATGVEALYFLDDANAANVITTPIIYSSEIADWRPSYSASSGLSFMDMRRDPGSGARTYLLRVQPHAVFDWYSRPGILEGYLLSGRYQGSECVAGQVVDGVYTRGGYFFRPAEFVAGGPNEKALEASVWLLRVLHHAEPVPVAGCVAADP